MPTRLYYKGRQLSKKLLVASQWLELHRMAPGSESQSFFLHNLCEIFSSLTHFSENVVTVFSFIAEGRLGSSVTLICKNHFC